MQHLLHYPERMTKHYRVGALVERIHNTQNKLLIKRSFEILDLIFRSRFGFCTAETENFENVSSFDKPI